VHLGDNS